MIKKMERLYSASTNLLLNSFVHWYPSIYRVSRVHAEYYFGILLLINSFAAIWKKEITKNEKYDVIPLLLSFPSFSVFHLHSRYYPFSLFHPILPSHFLFPDFSTCLSGSFSLLPIIPQSCSPSYSRSSVPPSRI